jgi:hypothetical protein
VCHTKKRKKKKKKKKKKKNKLNPAGSQKIKEFLNLWPNLAKSSWRMIAILTTNVTHNLFFAGNM